MRATAALLSLAFVGCASPGQEPPPPPRPVAVVRGAPIARLAGPELDEIARLEAAVEEGDGRLVAFLQHEDPRLRRRAAIALGRLPLESTGDEESQRTITGALCRALEDPETRLEAAFALGLRADPASAAVVAAYLNDVDPAFRRRLVEAASRIPDPSLHAAVLLALRDGDLSVRIEAALGTARWDPEASEPAGVDRALLDTLRPYTIAPQQGAATVGNTARSTGRTARTAPEAELVWRILFALSRRGNALGRGAFLEYASSDVPLERLYAVRGLARLEADPELVAAARSALAAELARGTGGGDWRVAYEATQALEAFADPSTVDTLLAAVEDENLHVRAGAVDALGAFPGALERTRAPLRRGLADLSVSVRNAALSSLARLLPAAEARQVLEKAMADDDAVIRLGVVQAAAHLGEDREGSSGGGSGDALAILHALSADPSLLVATRAVEGLGAHLEASIGAMPVRTRLHDLLAHTDNGIRLAAVAALQQGPVDEDVPHLIHAFRSSTGDIATEVAFNVVESLGKLPSAAGSLELVRSALGDPRAYVRRVARRVLAEDFGQAPVGVDTAGNPPDHPWVPSENLTWKHNPIVRLSTTQGDMLFELFPAETPVHVTSFLELAARGEYDGLVFHRVVPDFVIQGGDYRGDGNGGRPWQGESLRQEFTPRKYTRGSLGMPRNQNVDSGGSQIFVTHRPTPHLDGRYTIFGELRQGGEVLDRIEVGDRILSVTPLD